MSSCMDCKLMPKLAPFHRCIWCKLRKDGTDAEVAAAYERKASPMDLKAEDYANPISADEGWCDDCSHIVPLFYMKTKKRCRGCQLIKDRNARDLKQYGMEPGQRQQWYDAQSGKCWGCGNRQLVTGLSVHHSHLTGEPFFLACYTCNNQVMGPAQDNPMTLIRLGLGMLFPPHFDNGHQAINAILGQIISRIDAKE